MLRGAGSFDDTSFLILIKTNKKIKKEIKIVNVKTTRRERKSTMWKVQRRVEVGIGYLRLGEGMNLRRDVTQTTLLNFI